MARRIIRQRKTPLDDTLSTKPILQSRVGRNKSILPQTRFMCTCCGADFDTQRDNFYSNTHSSFYFTNNQFIYLCKECVNSLFDEYVRLLGNRIKALHRICVHFDYYYSPELAREVIKQNNNSFSILENYIQECNSSEIKHQTYDTYLSESKYEDVVSDNLVKGGETSAERWGSGIYNKNEIQLLEEHYQMLKRNNPNIDGNQEVFIKDLCLLNLQKLKSTKQGDTKGILDFTKAYRETFKQSQLQLTTETGTNDDTLGVTLEVISKYTPEEYYKDKELYKDFDNIGEYCMRHVFRPLKNLFFGTRDKDPEYQVKIEEGK